MQNTLLDSTSQEICQLMFKFHIYSISITNEYDANVFPPIRKWSGTKVITIFIFVYYYNSLTNFNWNYIRSCIYLNNKTWCLKYFQHSKKHLRSIHVSNSKNDISTLTCEQLKDSFVLIRREAYVLTSHQLDTMLGVQNCDEADHL